VAHGRVPHPASAVSDAEPTAVAIAGDFSLSAFAIGEGAAIYQQFESSTPVLTLPDRVTGIFEQYPFLYVQTGAGRTQIFNAARGYHPLNVSTASPRSTPWPSTCLRLRATCTG
jgi:hypothetical protein